MPNSTYCTVQSSFYSFYLRMDSRTINMWELDSSDSVKYLYLWEVSEPRDHALRLTVQEAVLNPASSVRAVHPELPEFKEPNPIKTKVGICLRALARLAGVCLALLCMQIARLAGPGQASGHAPRQSKLYVQSQPAMGTAFTIYLYAGSDEQADALFGAAFEEIDRLDRTLSGRGDTGESVDRAGEADIVSRLHSEESGSFLELVVRVSRGAEYSAFTIAKRRCQALRHAPYCEILVTSRCLKNERSRSSRKEPQSC